jgi:hypothetical protein
VTSATLLRDAEAALRRVAEGAELMTLESAFLSWLRGETAPHAVEQAFASPLRDYSDVALAGLAEAAGWSVDSTRLEDGLRWLVDVSLDRVGVPAPVVADGLAHVCLGLAARKRPWFAAWHDQVLLRAADGIHPAWLVGGGRVVRGEASVCAPELRVALASRGVATSTDADGNAFLEGLLRGELSDEVFRAHVLLAALEWTRRSAPVVLPGRATIQAVAEMLRAVPRALQQWPWEDDAAKPNRKAPAARWHIANEYHVQSLLWALLAPVFPDLKREGYAAQVGPIQPRVDLIVPSLRLAIEVKFARSRSTLKGMVNEIAEDSAIYFTVPGEYDQLLVFVWDNERNQQDHELVAGGMRKLPHVIDAVIVSRPGHMTDATPSDAERGGGT